jgi:ubiquinone/menaquinone biosynthesis C-methylase UbiE
MTTEDRQSKKTILREVFTRTAETYGDIRYFGVFGAWLVDVAGIRAGTRVLDVACGRGAVLFPAAERVGPSGRLVGIDLADGMAAETAAEIAKRGLSNAEARQMDAEHLDFGDGSFDVVTCGFSLQFFPALDRALAEFRRVLRPGGALVATAWGEDDERWDWFDEMRKRYGAALRLGSNKLHNPDLLKARLLGAGFEDVSVTQKIVEEIYTDEEEWWNVEWSISGREGLERLGREALGRFKEEAFATMQAQRTPAGFPYRLAAHAATGRAPAR